MGFEWRPHRGGLQDALDAKRTFDTFDDMVNFLRNDWAYTGADVRNVKAEPYGFDARIDWDTYIVSGELHYRAGGEDRVERAVFGFTNGDPAN